MNPGGRDLIKAVNIRVVIIKCICWQLGICFGQDCLFINNPSLHIPPLVQWIITATISLHQVLVNFLSFLLYLLIILFQKDHKQRLIKENTLCCRW